MHESRMPFSFHVHVCIYSTCDQFPRGSNVLFKLNDFCLAKARRNFIPVASRYM